MAYKYKNQLPTQALYYATRLFGSKAKNEKVKKMKDSVADCIKLVEKFKFYSMNEWVFDSASVHKLNAFVASSKDINLINDFEIDISKLNWAYYAMNFGYGLKCYILKEEASLPSVGYFDVV